MTRPEPQDPEDNVSEQGAATISQQAADTAEYGSSEHGGSEHNEFDCSRARLQLYEYLDGEMAPDDCAKIREHLAQCGPCLREYDLDQMLKALVRRSCSAETAPTQLRMQIMSRITTIDMTIEIRD